MAPTPAAVRKVFCAPGRGETYQNSLHGLLAPGAAEVSAVDFTPEFARLTFTQQMELFHQIICEQYWSRDALLLGRSFGAWILLNALMRLETQFPGTAILIASVLGSGGKGGLHFIAPRGWRFWEEAEARTRPPARRLALVHAMDDDQCPYALAVRLRQLWGAEFVALPGGGHGLGARTMRPEVSEAIERLWVE